jgi:preprotein translocase subunit SecB
MNEAKKANFSFEKFQIINFTFNEPKSQGEVLNIRFHPSGKYSQKEGKMDIYLDFEARDNNEGETPVITATMKAVFKFQSSLLYEEIPIFFFKNAIAIAFPYLRSFISTLSLQANIKPIVLPLMNLSELEKPLKENMELVK